VNWYPPYFRQQLICHLLSAGYFSGFVYWKFAQSSAPCSSPLLWCAQSTPPSLLHVLFSSLFIILFFSRASVSLSSGLCWFIPGVAVGLPHAAYLLTCSSVSPKKVYSLCRVAQEPSCFLSSVEKLCTGWGAGVSEFCLFLVFFSANCGSWFSTRFLIYRAHTVCFLPLLAILDPLR
jgi:hypothetical protein